MKMQNPAPHPQILSQTCVLKRHLVMHTDTKVGGALAWAGGCMNVPPAGPLPSFLLEALPPALGHIQDTSCLWCYILMDFPDATMTRWPPSTSKKVEAPRISHHTAGLPSPCPVLPPLPQQHLPPPFLCPSLNLGSQSLYSLLGTAAQVARALTEGLVHMGVGHQGWVHIRGSPAPRTQPAYTCMHPHTHTHTRIVALSPS